MVISKLQYQLFFGAHNPGIARQSYVPFVLSMTFDHSNLVQFNTPDLNMLKMFEF